MSELSIKCEKLLKAAARHPEGDKYMVQPDPLGLVKDRYHVFQFDIDGGSPFYLTLDKNNVTTTDGVSSLDRTKTGDWYKITNIWTTADSFKGILAGDKNVINEWHEGRWDFTSRNSNSPFHSWLCILLRLAREQVMKEQVKAYLSKEMEKGLGTALATLMGKIKGHPEGKVLLTAPRVVKNHYDVEVCEHTYQFELEDGEPFYLYMGKGDVYAKDGVSTLDRKGNDWNKISLLWTYKDTLKGVIFGEKNVINEWHEGRWDFSARNSNSPYHSWFCMVLRMAREQLSQDMLREFVA